MRGRTLLLASVILASGCIAPSTVAGGMADLRSEEGICAGARTGLFPNSDAEACLRVGTPGTLYDDAAKNWLVVSLHGYEDAFVNPGNWQVTVLRDGYALVSDRMRDDRFGYDVSCSSGACTYRNTGFVYLREPITPGVYEVELVYAHDTERNGRMVIRVE